MHTSNVDYEARCSRVQRHLAETSLDMLLVVPSSDLLYLIGLNRPQSERLTLLMLPAEGPIRLLLPSFELALAQPLATFFELVPWEETENPLALFASLLPAGGQGMRLGVAGKVFAHFLFRMQAAAPQAEFVPGYPILEDVRMQKSEQEIAHLAAAGAAADRVFGALLERPLIGQSEIAIKAQIMELLTAQGHDAAGGAIVGVGENGASPHHHVSSRSVQSGDAVVVDFGGTVQGYWSDMTRTFFVGSPTDEFRRAYETVNEANQLAFEAVRPGVTAESIDQIARNHISQAGYGEYFLHRTGHGLGLDIHEAPYIVRGDTTLLKIGTVFSIEPGIYIAGSFGIRIEDIVVVTPDGARRFNQSTHALQIIEA